MIRLLRIMVLLRRVCREYQPHYRVLVRAGRWEVKVWPR